MIIFSQIFLYPVYNLFRRLVNYLRLQQDRTDVQLQSKVTGQQRTADQLFFFFSFNPQSNLSHVDKVGFMTPLCILEDQTECSASPAVVRWLIVNHQLPESETSKLFLRNRCCLSVTSLWERCLQTVCRRFPGAALYRRGRRGIC